MHWVLTGVLEILCNADIDGDGKISSGSGRLGDTGDMKVIGNSTPRFLFGLDFICKLERI